jgi:ribosome-binding protein aMBF1 (putative translation factor)
VSEGDPENWAAVAQAISGRVRELGWRQRELAERSHVSVAVVREIQRHTVERRRSPRTLEALSVALGWCCPALRMPMKASLVVPM